MKYLLCGFGVSNKAVLKVLNKEKDNICIYDDNGNFDYDQKTLEGKIPFFDKAFISPGLCTNRKNLNFISKIASSIDSELNIGLKEAKGKVHIIGVTGSNGKTSTIYILKKLLEQNGCKVFICGNMGISLIDKIKLLNDYDYLLVEISSFQGEFLNEQVFDDLIVTSISPNHLDSYNSYREYIAAKKRICHFSKRVFLSEETQDILKLDNAIIINLSSTKGCYKNYLLAKNLLINSGFLDRNLNINNLESILPKFRYQFMLSYGGSYFINDSKSTSLGATDFALSMSKDKTILILGGHLKSDIDHKIVAERILIYGKEADKFVPFVEKYEIYNNLPTLIKKLKIEKKDEYRILFSPGGSSLEYKNFIERGEEFEKMVKEIYES